MLSLNDMFAFKKKANWSFIMESYTNRHKSLKGVWDYTSLVKLLGQIDSGNLLATSINSLSSFPVSVLLNSTVRDLEFQIPNSKLGNYEIQFCSLYLQFIPAPCNCTCQTVRGVLLASRGHQWSPFIAERAP